MATFQGSRSLCQGCLEFHPQVYIQVREFSTIRPISMFFVQLEFARYFPHCVSHLTQLTVSHSILDYDLSTIFYIWL
jgi:hypothetical protein